MHVYLLFEGYIIEKKIDSWAVRFAVGQCLNNGLTIYPKYSLVDNIGFDNEATHTKRFNSIYITSLKKNFVTGYLPGVSKIISSSSSVDMISLSRS